MSTKYYIVSEEELLNLVKAHAELDYESFLNSEEIDDFVAAAGRAMDVCLSRPLLNFSLSFTSKPTEANKLDSE